MSQLEQKKKSNSKARPLPIDIIREALEIDEAVPSGLRWKIRPRHHFARECDWKMWNTQNASQPAGSRLKGTIYYQVRIDGVLYRTHRFIYFLANGTDPLERHIDHIRSDLKLPNVALNLRLATNEENLRNQRKRCNNTSGTPGISWHKPAKKWLAQIKAHGKGIHLGLFIDFIAAVAARKAAEEKYFGEFAYDASQSRIASLYEHTQSRI